MSIRDSYDKGQMSIRYALVLLAAQWSKLGAFSYYSVSQKSSP